MSEFQPASMIGDPAGEAAGRIKTVDSLTERKQMEQALQQAKEAAEAVKETLQESYQNQSVLNALLRISLEGASLDDQLEQALDVVLSAPNLSVESKGAIFLVEDGAGALVRKAQRRLAPALLDLCARVPFGWCLCGRAAASGETQFAGCMDDRHEVRFDGIAPHGHYTVPLQMNGRVLGVLCLYLPDGSARDEREVEFLETVAGTLAGMIHRQRMNEELTDAHARAREMLEVVLPPSIADELERNKGVRPRVHDHVAVLFCDVAGFTDFCNERDPTQVVLTLQQVVEAYEDLMITHGLRKIKTIGDCFMATAGLLDTSPNPVLDCLRCGIEMADVVREIEPAWDVRVGIHVGPVVAGILGHKQYQYDLWGDTVNTASRMESNGVRGCVTMSEAAYEAVRDFCECQSLGLVSVKGKGELPIHQFIRWRDTDHK